MELCLGKVGKGGREGGREGGRDEREWMRGRKKGRERSKYAGVSEFKSEYDVHIQ